MLYLCGMLELVITILLCFAAIVIGLWLIGVGLRRLDDYKSMSKEDYQQLNEKAKRIVKLRQAEKCKQPKRRGFFRRLWDSLSDPSTLPEPIRSAMGHPF